MGKLAPNSVLRKFEQQSISSLPENIEKNPHKPKVSVERHRQNKSSLQAQNLESPAENFQEAKEHVQRLAGKKRDAHGNMRESYAVPAEISQAGKDKRKRKGNDDQAILLQEILALGGTEDDLDLVADVTSDDDIEGELARPAIVDGKFTKELSKFVAELGIEGSFNVESAAADLEEDENDANEQGLLEERQTKGGPVREPSTSASKDGRTSEKPSKDLNRLVSMSTILAESILG
jgi:ribosome biogenesis protein MAK21